MFHLHNSNCRFASSPLQIHQQSSLSHPVLYPHQRHIPLQHPPPLQHHKPNKTIRLRIRSRHIFNPNSDLNSRQLAQIRTLVTNRIFPKHSPHIHHSSRHSSSLNGVDGHDLFRRTQLKLIILLKLLFCLFLNSTMNSFQENIKLLSVQ